jgi:hypothetical protein
MTFSRVRAYAALSMRGGRVIMIARRYQAKIANHATRFQPRFLSNMAACVPSPPPALRRCPR